MIDYKNCFAIAVSSYGDTAIFDKAIEKCIENQDERVFDLVRTFPDSSVLDDLNLIRSNLKWTAHEAPDIAFESVEESKLYNYRYFFQLFVETRSFKLIDGIIESPELCKFGELLNRHIEMLNFEVVSKTKSSIGTRSFSFSLAPHKNEVLHNEFIDSEDCETFLNDSSLLQRFFDPEKFNWLEQSHNLIRYAPEFFDPNKFNWENYSWLILKIRPEFFDPEKFNWKDSSWAIFEHAPELFDSDRINWNDLYVLNYLFEHAPSLIDFSKIDKEVLQKFLNSQNKKEYKIV